MKIAFGSNADLHMSQTKRIIMLMYETASISVIFAKEHAQMLVSDSTSPRFEQLSTNATQTMKTLVCPV